MQAILRENEAYLTPAALRFLGDSIKAMAKRSTVGDRKLAAALHMGTHTINHV